MPREWWSYGVSKIIIIVMLEIIDKGTYKSNLLNCICSSTGNTFIGILPTCIYIMMNIQWSYGI